MMKKEEALKLIDGHKNKLINPVEMLHWTRLRIIINQIPDWEWEAAIIKAQDIMSR